MAACAHPVDSRNQMMRVHSGVGPIQDIVTSDVETRIASPGA
jgi:hypothetical protein